MSLELGPTTGKTTYETIDSTLSFLNGKLDHNLSGSALNLVYTKVNDSNFVYGGGYHSYSAKGSGSDSAKVTVSGAPGTLNTAIDTKISISGLFGLVGYNMNITDKLSFLPQLRLGIANSATIDYTTNAQVILDSGVAGTPSTGAFGDSASGALSVIALPLQYKSGNLIYGVQYQTVSLKYTTIDSGTDT